MSRPTLKRLDETYRKTAQKLSLGIEFKPPPTLEDVMEFRKQITLKQQPTTY
jgi:hypothetical protein